ncbi:unnamed protein product [Vitrella brassicaformis CCMP3155]|uniref:Uncharacterized protein n=1 Tax=Vitrella brassicaformis (strain CCMP3155) TaxID=1169540 RepID=A0A0G4FVL1_VITBC|nr:unnamed protein product [Vitrella brassicaformis CCMP3155]|mmetsp:Transcript_19689/g.47703  ORF Transcript_19689/g.47703 Transcript_19689/m.47703 type:complete len:303 (+) Transcript_19689:114-1022(+)|eukprot:CEM19254.1 unnamed protein product [Vitrella brassicaformis CCMP3155]
MPSVVYVVDAEAPQLHNEEASHTGAAAKCAPPVLPFDFFGLKVLLSKPLTRVEGSDFYGFILTHQLLLLAPVVFAVPQHFRLYDTYYYSDIYYFYEAPLALIIGLSIASLVLLAFCCWSFFARMSVLAPRSGAHFPHSKAGWQLTTHIIQLILLSSFLYFVPWFDVLVSAILSEARWNNNAPWVLWVVFTLVPIGVVGLWVLLFVLVTRYLGTYAISGEHATALAMAWSTVYCDTMRCVAVPFLFVAALSKSSYSLLWVFGLAMALCLIVVLIRLVLSLFSAKPASSHGRPLPAAPAPQPYV